MPRQCVDLGEHAVVVDPDDRVAWIGVRTRESPPAVMWLRNAHIFGAADLRSPVESSDSNRDFGVLPGVLLRLERVTDRPLVAAEVGLYQRSVAVAGQLLPIHPTTFGDDL